MCADINIYKELHLNKAELIAAIADDAEISKAKAEFALNSAIAVSYTHLTLPTNREV